MFANVLQHPKTSIAGVLIAVVTVAGVLTQQGITLGHAGNGTVVALIGALATALLGLFAKDPGAASLPVIKSSSTSALIAVLCLSMVFLPVAGCSQQQKINVAQEIVNWGPSITSAVDTINATAALLDPAAAPVFAIATTGFDALSVGLQSAAKDYLANPNQTTLALLQTEIIKLQQSVNQGLLTAAGIKNPQSQKMALAAINGLATATNAVLALVQTISTKQQMAMMSRQVTVHLAQVRPLLDVPAMDAAGARYGITAQQYFAFETRAGF